MPEPARDSTSPENMPEGTGHTAREGASVSALDVSETAAALVRYRARAALWVRVGVTTLLGAAVIELANTVRRLDWADALAEGMTGLALAPLVIGLSALRLARLMRRRLAAGPWRVCTAVAVPHGLHAAAVVLKDPATGELMPLTLRAMAKRHHAADPRPDGVLWWCGDPLTGGVVARPGGGELIWTRAPLGRATRQRVLRAAREKSGPAAD